MAETSIRNQISMLHTIAATELIVGGQKVFPFRLMLRMVATD
jgi:hypothetical protein